MLDAARDKLREARSFLGSVANEDRKIFKREPETQSYNLSALLTAAFSVHYYIIRKQGNRYTRWLEKRRTTLSRSDLELLDFMENLRHKNVHRRRPKLKAVETWIREAEAQQEITQAGGSYQVWSAATSHALLGTTPNTVARSNLYFDEGSGAPVVESCRRYLDLIDELITEYVQAAEAGLIPVPTGIDRFKGWLSRWLRW
jgi:hypothetical protein